jgi:hypothetical protein
MAAMGGGDAGPSPTVERPSPAEQAEQGQPVLGQRGDEEPAGPALGFPVFATKNTTRVSGADPVSNAAGVAQAVFPSRSRDTRPRAVVLVDQDDWRAGIAAAQLGSAPLRAPVLLTEGDELPEATADALDKLKPTGAREAGGERRSSGSARSRSPTGWRARTSRPATRPRRLGRSTSCRARPPRIRRRAC